MLIILPLYQKLLYIQYLNSYKAYFGKEPNYQIRTECFICVNNNIKPSWLY